MQFNLGIEECQRQKKWLREADYEVKGTLNAPFEIPRKARINRMKMVSGLGTIKL